MATTWSVAIGLYLVGALHATATDGGVVSAEPGQGSVGVSGLARTNLAVDYPRVI